MPTLSEAVTYVSDVVSPGRCPVNQAGQLDPDSVRAVNAAGRVLAKEGDWADLWRNITFSTIDHRIVLPDCVTSIRAAKIGRNHQEMRSPYFFHSQTAGGENPTSHSMGDAGNLVHEGVFPIQHDLPCATRLLVLFSEGAPAEKVTVTLVGTDPSMAPITETIEVTMNTSKATAQVFSSVSSVSKTVTSTGVFRVMPWSEERQEYGFPVVTLLPWETSGNYRRYFLPGIAEGYEAEVLCLCKLGWNRDYLSPAERIPLDNLFSLRAMCQALRALDSQNQKGYAEFRSIALGHMQAASADVEKGQAMEIDMRLSSRFSRPARQGLLRRRHRIWR